MSYQSQYRTFLYTTRRFCFLDRHVTITNVRNLSPLNLAKANYNRTCFNSFSSYLFSALITKIRYSVLCIMTLFAIENAAAEQKVTVILDRMDKVAASFDNYKGTGALVPRKKYGKEIPISVYVIHTSGKFKFKTVVREETPPHTSLLTFIGTDRNQQWLYSDTFARSMRLSVGEAYFIGSQFTYEDISSLWGIRRFEYEKTNQSESCSVGVCSVLLRFPKYRSGYSHQEVLIDEKYRIRKIRSFQEIGGEPIKEVVFDEYTSYGDTYLPHRILVQQDEYISIIRMDEYNLSANLRERTFNSRALTRWRH